ncbi:MAG: GAF domain-containing protein [Cyanobacteria bacterium HKST-UBA06]|nr:GAF domain-containing protein [Cyanobacteria bacterium HKST-UBA04]MCA9807393.1 GAF domain-containing protein [Cyanobacteria bacterium HKST-UBA06]
MNTSLSSSQHALHQQHSGDPYEGGLLGGLIPDGPATRTLKKGMLLRFKKEIPQAIEVIEKAYRLFESANHPVGKAAALIELYWLYGNNNERLRSEKLLAQAETLVREHQKLDGIHEMVSRISHYRGLLFYQDGEYGKAVKLFKRALSYCDPQGIEAAKIYDSLGVHYERTGDFHRAVRYLKSALIIKTRLQDPPYEEAITCQILGRLHLLYEDYELAHQNLVRSLQICTELKDEKRKATLNNELVRLFLRCGKEKEAIELIHHTRAECKNNRFLKIQFSMTCFYEAFLLYSHSDYDSALRLLEIEVFPIFQKAGYRKGLAMAKRLLAWINFALDPSNTTDPISLVCEAIELFRQENMIDEVAKSHFELGKLYHEVGNEELALASFLDALKMAEDNGLFYLTPYIEDEIFRIHEPRWEDIVNKRTRHERIFEKPHSLLDALSQVIEATDSGDTTGEDVSTAQELSELPETLAKGAQGANKTNIRFLMSLLKVGQIMAQERDLTKLLQHVQQETQTTLKAEQCLVFLYNSEANALWAKRSLPVKLPADDPANQPIELPAPAGIIGYVVKTGETINIENATDDPRFNPTTDQLSNQPVRSMLCMPLRNAKGEIIGVFVVTNKAAGQFTSSDSDFLLAITPSTAIAIENAQLYQERKISFDSFIKALTSTIDARDPITAGHSDRVTEYAMLIGEQMNLSDDDMEALYYAGLLHDIGKIGVKEEILMKKGRLTEKEYKHIQQHVYFTYVILNNIKFEKHLADVPEIAASHHEKMDGSGYFRGLKGEDIILGGRILAVADVFDAITSRRQYRNRMPFERVLKIFTEDGGRHFDESIIDYFLDVRLRDLGRVLCMDRHLRVHHDHVDQILASIPKSVRICDYMAMITQPDRTEREKKIIDDFDQLYNFSDISEMA